MNSSFDRSTMNETWLTPPEIIKALGVFDLDPCAAVNQPWKTAKKHYTINDNGLFHAWQGRVWCNPPYGRKAQKFMEMLKNHGNGIALIFARTETRNWFNNIWYNANAVLFIKGRLKFYDINGNISGTAGAPSALIAYGNYNALILKNSKIKGKYIHLK